MEKMTIISYEHKCCDCEYGYWAPKRWGSSNCYICKNKNSRWNEREMNGYHIFTCKDFEVRKE